MKGTKIDTHQKITNQSDITSALHRTWSSGDIRLDLDLFAQCRL